MIKVYMLFHTTDEDIAWLHSNGFEFSQYPKIPSTKHVRTMNGFHSLFEPDKDLRCKIYLEEGDSKESLLLLNFGSMIILNEIRPQSDIKYPKSFRLNNNAG
jgi:hypothetical protein